MIEAPASKHNTGFDSRPCILMAKRAAAARPKDRLIERYGLDAKLSGWSDEITADCPRKQVRDDYDARLLMLGLSEPNAGADEFGASIDRLLKAFTRLTTGCDGNVPCCIGFGR